MENCSTVEITRINELVQNLTNAVMIEPQVLTDITSELANVTAKNNTAILPIDLSNTINTVGAILR